MKRIRVVASIASCSVVCLAGLGMAGASRPTDFNPRTVRSSQTLIVIDEFQVEQADVRDALRALFKKAPDLSYSIAPDVQGNVTIHLRSVPLESALQNLLKQVDATYRTEEGIYLITKREPDDPQQGGAAAPGYGGQGGGFGGGGFGGQGGGNLQESYDRSVSAIERAIGNYLDGKEIKNILTPGEFSEWPLNLKAGQVVLAEARSDAFDPALEVVDGQGEGKFNVLATNDDRYPGDQRPLLLWRCTKDGAYGLRARCFRDKSGGQFMLRMRIYESMDLGEGKPVERDFDRNGQFLIRVPMKAGQIKTLEFGGADWNKYASVRFQQVISPLGLPDIGLASRLRNNLMNSVVAPVNGDYYVLASCYVQAAKTVRVAVRDVVPAKLVRQNGTASGSAPTKVSAVWVLSVKKGDVLEASTPDLSIGAFLEIAEAPNFAGYDVKKPETNPFFPKAKNQDASDDDPSPATEQPALSILSARARDTRYAIFVAKRDAEVWVSSNGAGADGKSFTMRIEPAAKEFPAQKDVSGQLLVGSTDYWYVDAQAGDVMQFSYEGAGFAESIEMLGPSLEAMVRREAGAAPARRTWDLVIQKPGRYLVSVGSIGGGGGGSYTLKRNVIAAREFKKGEPAKGSFATGDIEVWKFSVKANDPLLIHWQGTSILGFEFCDEKGAPATLPRQPVDVTHMYGILKLDKPKTFLIVLTKGPVKLPYMIELLDLPGYGKGG